jgi:hypothetical protein
MWYNVKSQVLNRMNWKLIDYINMQICGPQNYINIGGLYKP